MVFTKEGFGAEVTEGLTEDPVDAFFDALNILANRLREFSGDEFRVADSLTRHLPPRANRELQAIKNKLGDRASDLNDLAVRVLRGKL